MTGREKILEAIKLIDHHLQQSLSGDMVNLSSMDFDAAGLRLEDQLDILSALKDDYGCIEFSYKLPRKGKSEAEAYKELPLYLGVESWMKDIHQSYIVGKLLSERKYKIQVLSGFSDVMKQAKQNHLEKYAYHDSVLSDKPKAIPLKEYQNVLYVSLKSNGLIVVGIRGRDEFFKLGKSLRFDSPPYNFMRYILKNHDRPINIHEIQEGVEGCKTKNDLSELVRACHFDKDMKKIFFERTTRRTVRFTPWRQLDGEQLKWFEKWMESNRESIV